MSMPSRLERAKGQKLGKEKQAPQSSCTPVDPGASASVAKSGRKCLGMENNTHCSPRLHPRTELFCPVRSQNPDPLGLCNDRCSCRMTSPLVLAPRVTSSSPPAAPAPRAFPLKPPRSPFLFADPWPVVAAGVHRKQEAARTARSMRRSMPTPLLPLIFLPLYQSSSPLRITSVRLPLARLPLLGASTVCVSVAAAVILWCSCCCCYL